ncbi:MAG: hypothetical protein ACOYN2_03420 [Patescibacteria group bacterium]
MTTSIQHPDEQKSASSVIRKTFEPKQKIPPSAVSEIAFHPTFWTEAPTQITRQENIVHFLQNDSAIRLQIPGFKSFLIKSVESKKHRNGSWLLCGILAINRQGEEMGGAYLVEPEQIAK